MLTVKFDKADGVVTEREIITAGTVGMKVRVFFSPVWRTLRKWVSFQGSDEKIPVKLETTAPVVEVEVPWEVVTVAGDYLWIGIFGEKSDGTLAIPTIYINLGEIRVGATNEGSEGQTPTPTELTKLWEAIEALENNSGGGGSSGGTGADGKDGGYYVPSVDAEGNLAWEATEEDMPEVPSVNIRGPQGKQGESGTNGADGTDGADGKDGPYWIPELDSSGNLYWTISDGSQEEMYGGNIMGPQGPQGEAGKDAPQDAFWNIVWKNASPTSDMASQTLTIDELADYNLFKAIAIMHGDSGFRDTISPVELYFSDGTVEAYGMFAHSYETSGGAWVAYKRGFSITPSTGAFYIAGGTYNGATDNGAAIPQCLLAARI